MKKKVLLVLIFVIAFRSFDLFAQHLFSVDYNGLTQENASQITTQVAMSAARASAMSLARTNDNKDEYSFALSSVQNTKIVILNEQTGKNVVITPAQDAPPQFKLAPFFIEELRQAALGDADRYLVVETGADFSARNASYVSNTDVSIRNAATGGVLLPRYLYGPKENAQEAFPKDRQIVHIFKEKPRYIPANPNDAENLRYIAQLEENESYYVYMYELPDGSLIIYDEHFYAGMENTDVNLRYSTSANLQFNLTGNLTGDARTATLHALDLWGEQLAGTIPVDISIDLIALGSSTLGRSWTTQSWWDVTTQTYYASALASQLLDRDYAPGSRDIRLEMNSDFVTGVVLGGNTYTWNFGIAVGPTNRQYDWLTVMLHEITHGLGFFPLCREGGSYLYDVYGANRPGAYDRQLFQGPTGDICLTDLNQSGRAALITSDNLYSGAPGSNLLTANGGNRVKMYAPTTYVSGSSVSHWNDDVVNFTTFMKRNFSYGSRVITFNTRKIGMMLDMGWTQPDKTPPTPGNGGTITTANITHNSLTLKWTKATDNVSAQTALKYYVYQKSSAFTMSGNLPADGTLLNSGGTLDIETYPVSSLTPSTTYYFMVVVEDVAGNKAAYTAVNPTTSAPPTLETLTVNLTAGVIQVTLAPQTPVTGFSFFYASSASTVTAPAYGAGIGTITGATPYSTATNIAGASGTQIFVQVYKVEIASNTIVGFGEASATPVAPANAPSAPTGFTATPGNGQVVLAWTTPGDGGSAITGYELSHGATTGYAVSWIAISGSDATTETYTVTGLTNGTEYTFEIRAVNAIGNGTSSGAQTATPTAVTSPYLASGTIGSLYWTISYEGILTISGNGAIPNYTATGAPNPISPPWYTYKNSISSIVLNEGITEIGHYAFSGLEITSSIFVIPNSVTSIGIHALHFIGNNEGISISIPSGVTNIATPDFRSPTISAYIVDGANPNYSSENGVLFNKSKAILLQYPRAKKNTTYDIPNTVTSIGTASFIDHRFLTTLTIPTSVTSFGDAAFDYMSALKTIRVGWIPPIAYPKHVFRNTIAFLNYEDVVKQLTLAVPVGTKPLYEAEPGWQDFGTIIEQDLTPPTLATLIVSLTAGHNKVTVQPQAAAAGHAFYYSSSMTKATIPAHGVQIGTINGATLFTQAVDISGANGSVVYVQVYKVATVGNTIVGFGEESVKIGKVGDINGDSDVNYADLSLLLGNYGKSGAAITPAAADINGDDDVNYADLSILLGNYGK